LEFAEEVLDQMTPLVHLGVERELSCSTRMLGDNDLGAARVQVGDDGVAVEGFVSDQRGKIDALEERRHADRIVTMAGEKVEAHEVAERIGQRQDLCGHAALGAANGLALSPPFAPWPWRWTLTIVASTMAYSMSGSSEQASKSRTKTSALTQSRYRLNTVFHLPKRWADRATGSPSGPPTALLQRTTDCPCRFDPGPSACPDNAASSSPIGRQSKRIVPS